MREGVISKGRGGVRGQPRRICGTCWNRHRGGTDRDIGKGAGKHLEGSKNWETEDQHEPDDVQVDLGTQSGVQWCRAG